MAKRVPVSSSMIAYVRVRMVAWIWFGMAYHGKLWSDMTDYGQGMAEYVAYGYMNMSPCSREYASI